MMLRMKSMAHRTALFCIARFMPKHKLLDLIRLEPRSVGRFDKLSDRECETRSEATQGVWGVRSPVPHRGCHVVTGGWKLKTHVVRSDARGLGSTFTSAPTGAVTKWLGVGRINSTKKVGAANDAVPTLFCGDIEIRTLDPLLAKQVLYQLSYTPGLFQKTLD